MSCMCASSGVRLPFFWLQLRHAVTTFIHVSRPPRDMGRMWSQVSLYGEKSPPQKAHTQQSRLKSSRLLSGGAWLDPLMARALPRVGMIGVGGVVGGPGFPPGAAPAGGQGREGVGGELVGEKTPAAKGAHAAVAVEELAVIERRDLVESLDGERLAADGDDRVGGDAGALAGALGAAPVHGERLAADLPGDPLLGVIPDRLLPGDPAVGDAVLVERQDEGQTSGHEGLFASQNANLDNGVHKLG